VAGRRTSATPYNVGTGIAEVTDPALGLHMQGMADDKQLVRGVGSPLYARAFVVEQRNDKRRVAIVIADIWSGTRLLKAQLIARLGAAFGGVYSDDNLLLAGTHTHSAQGGYSGTRMYDHTAGGLDQTVANCIVTGCVAAVTMASSNLAPGRIYVNRGPVADCGRNRSVPAYMRNPKAERDRFGADTDKEMLLLKFVQLDPDTGAEQPIGALNWYAIHPTDLGQKNTLLSGDNKGYASALFEEQLGSPNGRRFVAAFANANCGDVSGSVELGRIPDGIHDEEQMQKHGRKQFEVALQLFKSARELVTGPIDYRHSRFDFSNISIEGGGGARTWPAALGVSFAAGSTEDSVPVPALPGPLGITEGLTTDGPGGLDQKALEAIQGALVTFGLGVTFGIQVKVPANVVRGHAPKPIVYAPGLLSPPAVPHVLPVQLLRIGTVAVPGIPGELTTMAGRRLRATVLDAMSSAGVKYVALGTYANDYAQYITTPEEYSAQHYEGASTLYGPATLAAFRQTARHLATAMVQGQSVPAGPSPGVFSAPNNNPYRFRNLSATSKRLRFYNPTDHIRLATLPNGRKTIPARWELWCTEREFTGWLLSTVGKVAVYDDEGNRWEMSSSQLLTIATNGAVSVGPYTPPKRR
jgi:neutral ceramidase